jgi:hypothetical protein
MDENKWEGVSILSWIGYWGLIIILGVPMIFLIILGIIYFKYDDISNYVLLIFGSIVLIFVIYMIAWFPQFYRERKSISRTMMIFDIFPVYNQKITRRFFSDFDERFDLVLIPGKTSDLGKFRTWYTRRYHLENDDESIVEVDIREGTSLEIMLMGKAKLMTDELDEFLEKERDDLHSEIEYYREFGGLIPERNRKIDQL